MHQRCGGNPAVRARNAAGIGLATMLAALPAPAAEAPAEHSAENRWVALRLVPRTPDQMAAFYEARGFSDGAIDAIREACFITAIMRNRSDGIVWLEPARWRFENADGDALSRRDETEWDERWEGLGIPQRHRATFGWTLLPERRDLHPDEPVGGNVTIERPDTPITVEARFVTGEAHAGTEFTLRFEDVRCDQEDS